MTTPAAPVRAPISRRLREGDARFVAIQPSEAAVLPSPS